MASSGLDMCCYSHCGHCSHFICNSQWMNFLFIFFVGLEIITFFFVYIPELPNWLLSENRPNDAKKNHCKSCVVGLLSMPMMFTKNFKSFQITARRAVKQRLNDRIKILRHKITTKAFVLVMSLNFLMEISLAVIWRPYIFQINQSIWNTMGCKFHSNNPKFNMIC